MTSRPVKRPRLALSCLVCSRRKVRCGREQPHCSNCHRLGETCVYNTGTRDPGTGRVLRAGELEEGNSGESSISNLPEFRDNPQPKAPSEQESSPDTVVLPSNYLSTQHDSQLRYVGKSFWGFVNGQEHLNDSFFFENDYPADIPPPHVSVTSLVQCLHLLPTKLASNALVQAFIFGVYPIFPLISLQIFQSECESFWRCFDADGLMAPPSSLVQDPTFTCLHFAVLFAGASVATESACNVPELKNHERKGMMDLLEKACHDSLTACKYTEHPTLNTLAASLLVHHFTKHEPLGDAIFIAATVRLAQSMGLHREVEHEVKNPLIREYRRRIWWHIVWFDVQTSLSTGLPTCCGNNLEGTPMIDQFILKIQETSQFAERQSETMKLAVGRYEIARLQNRIIHQLQDSRQVSENTITELVFATVELQRLINDQIPQLLDMGSSVDMTFQNTHRERFDDMKNATPQSNPEYYDDHMENNVIAWWADMTLALLRSEAILTLQKPLLSPPNSQSPSSQASWHSMAQLCLNYLQLFSLIQEVPAWEPWAWFGSTYYCPEQCALLILVYLKHHLYPENEQEMVTCVNNFLTHRSQTRPRWTGQDTLSMKTLSRLWEQVDVFSDNQRSTQSNDLSSTPSYVGPGCDVISRIATGQQDDRTEESTFQANLKGSSPLGSDGTLEYIFQRWFRT
ncbi:Cytochrome P450 [Penicillium atrosanguineum]|uniref:Cytochrome P450 n=1 Tax=Penicillium atrosanguineum TaxID=1132637 RepID=UPI002389D308|nr:Cytochrome P450 [Penicillium atrosanguineum]KAJ5289929.1 Cytochrome P450 [Penicillium atrosanguineum]